MPKDFYTLLRPFLSRMASNTAGEIDDDTPIEDILDTIGDPYARDVLASICREARSAQELAEDLDHSIQTIYRRIDLLEDHDLVTSRTVISDDGNHYDVYESNFNSALISLEDDEYDVRIYREENLPDRFGGLWDELSGE